LLEYSFLEGELSAESVEEILQLFGNYHQLSEILKEKANTADQRGSRLSLLLTTKVSRGFSQGHPAPVEDQFVLKRFSHSCAKKSHVLKAS